MTRFGHWLVFPLATLILPFCPALAREIYVAPDGNDAWTGKYRRPTPDGKDGPLATLGGARDLLRRLPRRGVAVVRILPGRYELREPVVFEARDSNVVYQAEGKGKAVFSGGRILKGFKTQPGGYWTLDIPEVAAGTFYFEQLFINGRRAVRARMPNEYYHYMIDVDEKILEGGGRWPTRARQTIYARREDIESLFGLSSTAIKDALLVVYHKWDVTRRRLDAVDPQSNALMTTGRGMKAWNNWHTGTRYHLENVKTALDAPGEWFLERNGRLTYIPRPGEKAAAARVVAPVSEKLVIIRGEPAKGIVKNLTFRGLSFQHTSCPTPPGGHEPQQAAAGVEAAIMIDGADAVRFEDCEISRIGTYCIWFRRGCRKCGIFKTHMHDFGAGGVRIGETKIPRRPEDRTSHVTVDNCIIHDGGHIFPCAVGVWIGHSPDNRVTHNEIADLYYSAVSVGWRWGYGESPAKRNLVLFNHIHHLGYGVLSDMGAVYTLGPSAGTKVNNNVIHDVHSYSYGGWGLYTDEGSSDIEMANNLVYHTKSGGFHQHYGRDNLIHNNIFAFNQLCQVKISRAEAHRSVIFRNNIVIYDTGVLFQGPMHQVKLTIDRNLYWNPAGQPVRFLNMSLADWRKSGRDLNSRIADPMFTNARDLDFKLEPGSPALKLGFKPFDYSQAGVYGDRTWKQLANAIPVKPMKRPPQPPMIPLKDDFERRSPGNPPRFATVQNEGRRHAIAISAETAATGRQSLKIEDSPSFRKPFNPHLFYAPKFNRGAAVVNFHLRLPADADITIEWRDYADGYRVGPRLHVTGGKLRFAGKSIELPINEWIHFEITAQLGTNAGTWNLKLDIPGKPGRHFTGLDNIHSSFKELDWIGFISNAEHKTAFYLDNIEIRSD